ncbi:MAG: glycoside hydrolase family 16 protein [Paludibacteraceae bacterium]|nr:glycoside hydrolase family 16 protein [Paludibacteraceae bacterium]
MKKKLLLLAALAPVMAFGAKSYELVWEDDFNDPTINATYWNLEDNARGGGNAEMQYYTPKNVTIEQHPSGVSCLVLNAMKENYKNRPATSARINTQDKIAFRYGKLEVRVQMPYTADGLWPAFWLLGNDLVKDLGNDDTVDRQKRKNKKNGRVVWPKCGEIDMLEMGHRDGIAANAQDRYFNGACHWGEDFNDGAYPNHGEHHINPYPLQGSFHTFTLYWTPDSITMYVDQDQYPDVKPYFTLPIAGNKEKNTPSRYFHKPFYIVSNLAVGGYFTGLPAPEKYAPVITDDFENFVKITETALPADGTPVKMYIDYIRLYQRGDRGEQLIIKQ